MHKMRKKEKRLNIGNLKIFVSMRLRLLMQKLLKTKPRTWVKVVLVMFVQMFAYYFYTKCVSVPTLGAFLENKKLVIVQAAVSVICSVMALNFIILIFQFKLITKIFLVMISVISLYFMWGYDQLRADGKEFHYGYWAARGYFALVAAFQTISIFLWVSYRVIRKCRIPVRTVGLVVGGILAIVFLYVGFVYINRRPTFDKGLFGEKFDETRATCRINNDVLLVSRLYPKFFFHTIFLSHWCTPEREFVSIVGENDPRGKTTTIEIDTSKISRKDTCHIELFPNIHDNYNYEELRNYDYTTPWWTVTVLQKHFMKKMKVVDPIDTSKPYTYDAILYETVLVRCGKHGNIIVNPKRKYDDRKGVHDVSPLHPNIILLWFDSESRKAFEYDFPLSVKYIEKEILSKKKKEDETKNMYDFYQFFSHYVIGWNTYPQFLCMFNGVEKKNMSTILWETAKKNGWITVYSDDECNEASSRYNKQPLLFDYTHLEPYCLEEYTDPQDHFSVFKGPLAVGRRCLFQHEGPQYIFEYFKKIENIYPEKAKFFYAMFDEAHEGTGEAQRYIDRYLMDYLKFLNEKGALEHTIIYFFADHGNHMSIVLNMFKEGKIGGMNPLLSMLAPADASTTAQKKNLEANQHRIITAYDLHKTWSKQVLSDAEWNTNGLDFINQEVPFGRTCKDAAIPRCYGITCKEGDKWVEQPEKTW